MQLRWMAIPLCCAVLFSPAVRGQQERTDVRVALVAQSAKSNRTEPAVVWLEPLAGTAIPAFPPRKGYTLLQKNRTFQPHLLVIPVGSVVQFPNADPFFHNVFSLFDGKRFDLGLYEAGSFKAVTFSREGVSYIFCNIHPEMSAVVIALSTPLFTVGTVKTAFTVHEVPHGDYRLHIWVEGAAQKDLNDLTRVIHVGAHSVDAGKIEIPMTHAAFAQHTDEYGHAYRPTAKVMY